MKNALNILYVSAPRFVLHVLICGVDFGDLKESLRDVQHNLDVLIQSLPNQQKALQWRKGSIAKAMFSTKEGGHS